VRPPVPDRLPPRPIKVARVIEARPADAFDDLRDLSTRARVSWHLEPTAEGTLVRLRVAVGEAARADRLPFAIGGRRWLHRRLRPVLRTLAQAPAGIPAAAPAS